jgi:phage/plasmid-associated DNA primase
MVDGVEAEEIGTLQEWFGYILSGRTDLQKILLLIGPRRSGKGTTSRPPRGGRPRRRSRGSW